MNFEDEEYVRVYSKETVTYKKLGWEGRAVLWHLFLKADRSGAIDLEAGDDEVESVAALIDMPEEVVRVGLDRLASRGVTTRHGTSLVITKFVEAQNAKRSDRLRAQEYRDRRRAEQIASEEPSQKTLGETQNSSRTVTENHGTSQPVTIRHSSPPPPPSLSPASPPPAEESGVGLVGRDSKAIAEHALRDPMLAQMQFGQVEAWPEVVAVCDAFAATWGREDKPRHQGDPRARAILGRLAEGCTVAQLIAAVRGSRHATYIAEKRAHQTLVTILRDGAQVDKFGALTEPDKAPAPPPGRGSIPPAEERRMLRNNLLADAAAGRYGEKAKAWHESGADLSELADKLEKAKRPAPAVRQLIGSIGR